MTAIIEDIDLINEDISRLSKELETKKNRADVTLPMYSKNVAALEKTKFKVKRTLRVHRSKIYGISWSKASKSLISISMDGKLVLWNVDAEKKRSAIDISTSWPLCCSYSPDDTCVASAGLDDLCSVYYVERGKKLTKRMSLSGHQGCVTACEFLDPERIITGSSDATCILWNIPSEKKVLTFRAHVSDITSISIFGSQGIFASGSVDTLIRIWDARTSTCVQTFKSGSVDVNSVKFFPDGNDVAAALEDGCCKLFDMRYDGELCTYVNDTIFVSATSVDFSKSGRLLFVGYGDTNCRAWDTIRGGVAATLDSHIGRISGVKVSGDGEHLGTASWDGTIKIWACS